MDAINESFKLIPFLFALDNWIDQLTMLIHDSIKINFPKFHLSSSKIYVNSFLHQLSITTADGQSITISRTPASHLRPSKFLTPAN